MMKFVWLSKILFLLWMTQSRVAVKQQIDCGVVARGDSDACEGENITLACPEEKPWLEVTSAIFGRDTDELHMCLRPGNKNPDSTFVECVVDVRMNVTAICAGQTPCVFNVPNAIFPDPCPKGVYKYLSVTFNCHCRRRYTRSRSTTCFPRKSHKEGGSSRNYEIESYTIIHPTPTVITIRQPMSQNVTKIMRLPIRMTAVPTTAVSMVSTRSPIITATMSASSSRNITVLAQSGHRRNKVFSLMVGLFFIYNEAANEDPPMALMWCLIGILLGLFIIAMTFLFVGLRKKPKHRDLFRLSQLESEEGEITSPTIHTTTQFPESPDSDGRQDAVQKLNATRGKNVPEGLGSWSDLLKKDTSLYINPLWRGWREGYVGLTGQAEEAELDTGTDEREGLSRSEPWNLRRAGESDDTDHRNCDGEGSSKRNSNNSHCSNSGSETNDDSSNQQQQQQQQQQDIPNTEQSNTITDNNDSSRGTTNKRRSIAECDNLVSSIPVGIPSLPVADPGVFHTQATHKAAKNPGVSNTATTPEAADDVNQAKEGKASATTSDYKPASNKLLTRFGIDDEEASPSSRSTALSSPCLYDTHSRPDNQDLKSSPNTADNSRLKVLSRPIRSRSLDSSCPAEITPLRHTHASPNPTPHKSTPPHNPQHPTSHNTTSQHPTTHDSATQHQNKPPPYVKNKDSLGTKVSGCDETNSQPRNEESNHQPVTKRQAKHQPMDRRASSGYYSNNASPLVEYPAGITMPENSGKNSGQRHQKESSVERQKSLSGDDDLPPLPPPPPPFIPISPLPHMCMTGYREPKTKKQNNVDKNPSRTAIRKVHFKSSE